MAKTNTGCKILQAHWYQQGLLSIGMVLVDCELYKVAYVGCLSANEEEADAVWIAENGCKLSKDTAAAEFKGWDFSDYKVG